jgi:hypothetical protein
VYGTLEQLGLINPEEIGFSGPVPKNNFRRMVGKRGKKESVEENDYICKV